MIARQTFVFGRGWGENGESVTSSKLLGEFGVNEFIDRKFTLRGKRERNLSVICTRLGDYYR